MNGQDVDRLIKLLNLWKDDELEWGEFCELREFTYDFYDSVQEEWSNYGK